MQSRIAWFLTSVAFVLVFGSIAWIAMSPGPFLPAFMGGGALMAASGIAFGACCIGHLVAPLNSKAEGVFAALLFVCAAPFFSGLIALGVVMSGWTGAFPGAIAVAAIFFLMSCQLPFRAQAAFVSVFTLLLAEVLLISYLY